MTASRVVAIDGPAASGKSSTARAVAERLRAVHIDSGALYRAATWLAITEQLTGGRAIAELGRTRGLTLVPQGTGFSVRLAGDQVDTQIRTPAVDARVSEVAAYPEVRDWVNGILREGVAGWGGAVMDGRDIGTAVFPSAVLKVFLTASPVARARRRLLQVGATPTPEEVAAEASRLADRDRVDAEREVAPLRQAPDALLLDTTNLTFAQQVDQIVGWARDRGL